MLMNDQRQFLHVKVKRFIVSGAVASISYTVH